jgi:glycosyltransferase involved in cell wall biosynthesis
MNADPTISVVIPCYNAAPFLCETLDSVFNQTYPVLEVLVIDDGSTDGSGQIADSYGPPVRVIRQKNQGESVARNRGMDEARGDWIALLDADDRWVPYKLERQMDALRQAPDDVVCVYSDFVLFGSVRRQTMSRPMCPKNEVRIRALTDPWIGLSTAVIRSDIARKVRFPTNIRHGEERVFWFLFSQYGSIVHVPEPLFEYRKHPTQQTSQPGHGYRVYACVWRWLNEHPDAVTNEELAIIRRELARLLVSPHDCAFWTNNVEVRDRSRALYRDLLPGEPLPPLFARDSPSWALCSAHAAWNTLLDLLPTGLRVGLWRAARRRVERIKRGRVGADH